MLRKMGCFFLMACAVTIFIISPVQADELYMPQFKLEGAAGENGVLGGVGLLIPVKQDKNSLFYTDFRGMKKNDVSELNLGMGYRKILDSEDQIIGAYFFRDRRKQFDEYWNQWTVGTEYITDRYSLSVNTYLPDDDKILAWTGEGDMIIIDGTDIKYQEVDINTYYRPMKGYDFEIGAEIPGLPIDMGVYYKYFSFSQEDMDDLSGSSIRIETVMDNEKAAGRWTLGLEWQEDNVRGSMVQGTVALQIPFGYEGEEETVEKELSILEEKMTEFTRRDVDVVVNETKPKRVKKQLTNAVNPGDNSATVSKIWFATADGDGLGSQEDPTNLSDLFSKGTATGNDIIVLLGDSGEFTESVQLMYGQKLLSPGGHTVLASGATEGRTAVYRPEGIQATLQGNGGDNIVALANDNTVSGLILDNGDIGIFGKGISGSIHINNNDIVNMSKDGIYIYGAELNNVQINGNGIDNVGRSGIHLKSGSVMVDSLSTTIDSGFDDFYIDDIDSARSIEITGNIINTWENGIIVDNESLESTIIDITGNSLENIDINTSKGDVVISKGYNTGIYVDTIVFPPGSKLIPDILPISIVKVSDNTFNNLQHSINVGMETFGLSSVEINNNIIDNNDSGGFNGITYRNASLFGNVSVNNNKINNDTYDSGFYGIGINSAYHYDELGFQDINRTLDPIGVIVSGNIINGYDHAVNINTNSRNINIIDNKIYNAYEQGISVDISDIIRKNSYAIPAGLARDSYKDNVLKISGNIIEDSYGDGIYIDSLSAKIDIKENSIILNEGEITNEGGFGSRAIYIRAKENSMLEAYIRGNIMDKARTGIFLDNTPSIRSKIISTSEINAVLEDNQFGSDIDMDLIGLGTGIYVNGELLLIDD